jgi:Ca2+-transporting ATPase
VVAPRWQRVRRALAIIADPMALMLLVAGALDLALGHRVDAAILFAALLPVLAVDVLLEARSTRAIAALRAAVAPTARVVRDGAERQIATEALVPGDLLVVREGYVVFADARVVDGGVTDESNLKGEPSRVRAARAM